jgi:hypothetical protein
MNWKGYGRKLSSSNFKALSWHLPGGTEENHENLRQGIWSPGRDMNPGPPEYEAGVLTTRPRLFDSKNHVSVEGRSTIGCSDYPDM